LWRTVKPGSGNIPVPAKAVSRESKVKESGDQRVLDRADNVIQRRPGSEYPNCGAKKSCADDEISVRLYTGTQNKDPPKICVDGT